MVVEQSILKSTKKILGIDPDFDVFDLDIITHINTTFVTLNQLGIGPPNGYMIEDFTATWTDFVGTDKNLNMVKSYVYIRVRLLFDPPTNPSTLASYKETATEYEWRLNVDREHKQWVNPNEGPDIRDDTVQPIVDGGVIT